jgi:hypothetical protein
MIRDADQETRGPRAESSPVDSTAGSAPFSSAETVVSRHSTAHGTKRCANNHKKPTKSLAIPVSTQLDFGHLVREQSFGDDLGSGPAWPPLPPWFASVLNVFTSLCSPRVWLSAQVLLLGARLGSWPTDRDEWSTHRRMGRRVPFRPFPSPAESCSLEWACGQPPLTRLARYSLCTRRPDGVGLGRHHRASPRETHPSQRHRA